MEDKNAEMIKPRHISIIMDGNGRWANQRQQQRIFGHMKGRESVKACIEESLEQGIEYLSLFAFSQENWQRSQQEVHFLMELMLEAINQECDSLIKNGVKFLVIGDKERLSEDIKLAISGLEEKTKGNTRLNLIIFLSYSGQWDILQAVKKLAKQLLQEYISLTEEEDLLKEKFINKKIEALSPDIFASFLATQGIPNPDLLIRTSGEQRISNYMLWQLSYTELLFVDKMWPEFTREDLRNAIEQFSNRERRYGKVK